VRRFQSLATAITVVSIAVSLVAIAVITVGVLVVAQSTFSHLMREAGTSAAETQAMFDHGIEATFVVAIAVAAVVSAGLAMVLAALLARPLQQMAHAARRIAKGDYATRVGRGGPQELASLADSFNQMARSLEEQERLRREFVVNAAHELHTPLTNLQGYLEALRDGVIAPTPEQFGSLHEEAQRLVRLSRSLDTLAESEFQARSRACEKIALGPAVRSAYEVARPAFEAKSISVDVAVPDTLEVVAEPDGLAQVLGNLLQNACRYTPAGGHAGIQADTPRSHVVVVSVTNSGAPIPAGDLAHVFERFYRVEKSRDAARGGAGIGLAIVKQVVEAAGGSVGVDSDDRSTRFWFSLPSA
jgi:signal transduction histidine kinase